VINSICIALICLSLTLLVTAGAITAREMIKARPMPKAMDAADMQIRATAAKSFTERQTMAARRDTAPKPAPLPKDKLATQITRPAWYVASMKEHNEAQDFYRGRK
jgi:hypothetical protein